MADLPKYVILHGPDLDALMELINERTVEFYVVYGGLQFLNGEFVQIMVKRDDKVVEETAALVWEHFKDSGVMIRLPEQEKLANLMRDAQPEILEALKGI